VLDTIYDAGVMCVVLIDSLGFPLRFLKGNTDTGGTNFWSLVEGTVVVPRLRLGHEEYEVMMASGKGVVAENDGGVGVVGVPCGSEGSEALIAVHSRNIDPGLLLVALRGMC
jgi:hypothetical protein